MHHTFLSTLLFLLAPPPILAVPTLHLCGDSTMAITNGHGGHGFGVPLEKFFLFHLSNAAVPGQSSRSYTVQGYFDRVASQVARNDIVLIEFGMNDGGSLSRFDNLRSPCRGEDDEVCNTDKAKNILTYSAYIRNAVRLMRGKGAKVIVSGPIPKDVFGSGRFAYGDGKFNGYARNLVAKWFARDEGVEFVDHARFVAGNFHLLGKKTVRGFYLHDDVHPSNEGAEVVARAFVEALWCSGDKLLTWGLTREGRRIPARCKRM